jgi:Flp pilus assembly protein TadD
VKKLVAGLGVGALLLAAGAAHARNFHCAGGVQYVIQGMKEKDKGNTSDANRIFNKAVVQLNECTTEDPKDAEAWGYMGWAYGELDSATQAGNAFEVAVEKFKDDPKGLKRWEDNRKSYWVKYYNEGLQKYREANAIIPVDEILNSKDPKVADAKAKLAEAEHGFKKAIAVSSREVKAYDNLAIVEALQGNFEAAGATIDAGLAIDPANEELKNRKESMLTNTVTDALKAGDYPGAITTLDHILIKSPTDFGLLARAAQVNFEYGQKLDEKKDEANAKTTYTKAAEYFGRASAAAPGDQDKKDMKFNQSVALQNAGDFKGAAHIVFDLVQESPKDRNFQSMLRGAYDRMGSKKKADDQVWVVLGLNDTAAPVADVAAYTSKIVKASDAGKVLGEQGAPEEVKQFKSGETVIDIWYYWPKKKVFAFSASRQVGSANFGDFGPETGEVAPATPGASTKSATTGAKKG